MGSMYANGVPMFILGEFCHGFSMLDSRARECQFVVLYLRML